MRLYRFILDKIEANLATLSISESNHLRNVLRINPGTEVILFDLNNNSYFLAKYLKDENNCCVCEIISAIEKKEVPQINLFVALVKSEINEFVVEKAVELGVQAIYFYSAKRSQEVLKASNLEKKLQRFKKIAISAIKQCGSPVFPEIKYFPDLSTALLLKNSAANKLIFLAPDYENKDLKFKVSAIAANLKSRSAEIGTNVLIGPEGGLTEEEIKLAFSQGYLGSTLGNTTLRVETAVIVALGNITNRLYE